MNAEQVAQRLEEGKRLHDHSRYDDALAVYRSILQADPSEPSALYEAAYTLHAKGEPRQAQALLDQLIARGRGGREFLAGAFGLLGAIHDELGELDLGEKTFRRGLEWSSANAGLRYALGVNLLAQGRAAEATSEFIRNLVIRPDHPRGWAKAGDALWATTHWAWALLAWGRSLTLDLDPPVAQRSAELLWEGLFAGVDVQAKELCLPPLGHDEESLNQTAENLVVAMSASGRFRQWAECSDSEFFVLALENIVTLLGQLPAKSLVSPSRQFWHRQLHGFFATAQASGWLVAAAYLIRAPLGDPQTSAWLSANAPRVERFRTWARSFRATPAAPATGSQ
jgi:hypothetical protein